MKLLTETFGDKIALELSCYDRLIITGNMPEISHCQGMTSYLYQNNVKIFDYPKFAEPNDISFFKHFREVVTRDGTTSNEMASLKKNIYSLAFLKDNLKASNKRYFRTPDVIIDNQ